ncbi:MAG: glycosyltransferase [Anaerolineales bacterium]|nr:glycosyltransferase [Anaerolineales bacterium]
MDRVTIPGRLGLQQRVLPSYRAPFFDALAVACTGGLSVFAGEPRPRETIVPGALTIARHAPARNRHLLGGPLYLCHQGGLQAWLEDWDPQALIVEANPRYLATPSAVDWMQRRGRPIVGWGLGAPPLAGPLAGLRRAWRLSFLRRFDALLTYSRRGADEYAALGFPAGQVFVAPNAAAPAPDHPLPERPAVFNGRPGVLFVGRLQARKRVDLLLHACAALPADLQPELVVVGDGPERPALEVLAGQVYPRAQFPGAKHGPDLAPYFRTADLFVLPGTGGLAVQEAMTYGLPVVMGQGDGTNDDLVRSPAGTSPGNGWQVPPDDAQALTTVLREALADPARLRAMGAESYRIVAEEINWERMVAVFVEVVNSLLYAAP